MEEKISNVISLKDYKEKKAQKLKSSILSGSFSSSQYFYPMIWVPVFFYLGYSPIGQIEDTRRVMNSGF